MARRDCFVMSSARVVCGTCAGLVEIRGIAMALVSCAAVSGCGSRRSPNCGAVFYDAQILVRLEVAVFAIAALVYMLTAPGHLLRRGGTSPLSIGAVIVVAIVAAVTLLARTPLPESPSPASPSP
jgi:hypothetical protein